MDRFAKLLSSIDEQYMVGLEIGPLHRPTLKKSQGKIFYADFASTEYLKNKYKEDPHVDILEIVDVDFVVREQGLRDACGGGFDFVIASHVAEHVPNLVGWLQEVEHCLLDDGVLSLALPDKRFTFDHLRSSTSIQSLLAFEVEDLKRPNALQIIDFIVNFSDVSAEEAWKGFLSGLVLPSNAKNTFENALTMAKDAFFNEVYHDVHCTVFSSYEFVGLMHQLAEMEKLSFYPVSFFDTAENDFEFFISMKKSMDKNYVKLEWESLRQRMVHSKKIMDPRELQTRLSYLEETLNNLLISKSWKITEPLRRIRKVFDKN
jgi:SAM-dependent methyltransferase